MDSPVQGSAAAEVTMSRVKMGWAWPHCGARDQKLPARWRLRPSLHTKPRHHPPPTPLSQIKAIGSLIAQIHSLPMRAAVGYMHFEVDENERRNFAHQFLRDGVGVAVGA